jgi:spermine/spermidine synthase
MLLGSATAPALVYIASRAMLRDPLTSHGPAYALMALALVSCMALTPLFRRLEPLIDAAGLRQDAFLNSIPEKYLGPAIFTSAALSLFLELAVIRWQASVFELFAFYKNLSLLACFAGLGLGYALASRKVIPLFLSMPLFAWQFVLLLAMRYGLSGDSRISLKMLPFSEQLNMGLPHATTLVQGLQTYYVLALVFTLTALAFIPIGQLCGCLLERREKLSAYGLNLAGSIAGVLLMFALSAFWTPPVVWFLVAFAFLLVFHVWKPRPMLFAGASALVAMVVLAWPTDAHWQKIYSPYQLLEVGQDPRGLLLISAAGHYYQRVHDLARANHNVDADPELAKIRSYYELPYWIYGRSPQSVAVVGAGTGNDVAAGLRNGAERIDAIEIDPAILMEGRSAHPEHPYSNPRVHAVVNDARTFLRSTNQHYDMVVYGLLDSHTLLSHASSVRLDSFVYTVEGLRDARAHLNRDGVLSLSFALMNPHLGRKIYLMLQQTFDGRPPICVRAGYDGAVIFLEANDRQLSLPPAILEKTGFHDVAPDFADPKVLADVSTDDWPFFYMPRRVYPVSYVVMGVVVLALSVFIFSKFLDGRPQFGTAPFFFLGAGFMLIETKAITELGLAFGNSWQVIGIVIIAILVMAFFANLIVRRFAFKGTSVAYLLLLVSLGIGWTLSGRGSAASSWVGHTGLAIVLTSPIFFSGIVFSTLLRSRGGIAGMLAMNLLGAMCGGLLEYNAMYFGFRFLYIVAAALYVMAFASEIVSVRRRTQTAVAANAD